MASILTICVEKWCYNKKGEKYSIIFEGIQVFLTASYREALLLLTKQYESYIWLIESIVWKIAHIDHKSQFWHWYISKAWQYRSCQALKCLYWNLSAVILPDRTDNSFSWSSFVLSRSAFSSSLRGEKNKWKSPVWWSYLKSERAMAFSLNSFRVSVISWIFSFFFLLRKRMIRWKKE